MINKEILNKLSLEEKATLCSGKNFWKTEEILEYGVGSITFSDGPYGVRKQGEDDSYLDFNTAKKFICFPTAAGMGASFDRKIWRTFGETLGDEANSEEINVLLGPAMNIKRSPLGGRNFEYISEDPLVSGALASEYVKGLQSKGVGASVKHFAMNNQETRRMSCSSNTDERTLREIYLSGFEKVVKESNPKTVMCSYNKINNEYVSESKWLLKDILRDEWGFEGCIVTDWGASCDRIKGILAGVDIEMPSCGDESKKVIVKAVEDGKLKESELDKVVDRIISLALGSNKKNNKKINYIDHHYIATKLAEDSMVLLKNKDNILPLSHKQRIAVIGKFAEKPRYEGGGSSHINSWKVETPLEALNRLGDVVYEYSKGYESYEYEDMELISEACINAKNADCAVIFVGLPDEYESESYDRKNMNMPKVFDNLIERIAEVNENVIVVLQNGAPVSMPWESKVSSILEAYLAGEGVGEAITNILYGKTNPSGRLAETIPVRIEDTPCYMNFPGYKNTVDYAEGVFVGYRYYLSKHIPVKYPFGYGLSYTSFNYETLKLNTDCIKGDDVLEITVIVKNVGKYKGKELVQIYVEPNQSTTKIARPLRELKAFEKIELNPNESKEVKFVLHKRDFAYFDNNEKKWQVDSGIYKVQIGKDCTSIVNEKEIQVIGENNKIEISRNTLIGDILEEQKCTSIMESILPEMLGYMGIEIKRNTNGQISRESVPPFIYELPMRTLISFTDGKMKEERLSEIIDKLQKVYGQEE